MLRAIKKVFSTLFFLYIRTRIAATKTPHPHSLLSPIGTTDIIAQGFNPGNRDVIIVAQGFDLGIGMRNIVTQDFNPGIGMVILYNRVSTLGIETIL